MMSVIFLDSGSDDELIYVEVNDRIVDNSAISVGSSDESSVGPDESFIIDLVGEERPNAEAKYGLLQEMFPDAEPTFLQAKCTQLALDNAAFDSFLENVMIPQRYPRKVKAPALPQEKDSSNAENGIFILEEFLKKFPDPVKHFVNSERGFHYVQYSSYYLQKRYKFHSVGVIRLVLQRSGYCLATADQALRNTRKTRKVERRQAEFKVPEGFPPQEFFDEVAFIENREVIEQVLSDRELARSKAVEEARKANALLTCGCCFSDDNLVEEVAPCPEGHLFCKSCILRSSEVLMGDGKLDFPCLQDCAAFFSLETLKSVLPENMFAKLEKKLQEREVTSANIPGLETCAFCEYSAIPPEESRVFECDNCKKHMCRLCRKESHIPLRCMEVVERNEMMDERKQVEERMTDALLRTCWRCKTKFVREDGCNKMTCVCGARMCYICREPIKTNSYDHFYDREFSDTNPEGKKKCPLWVNNAKLHSDEVDREGMKAMNELKRKNPELEQLLYKKKKK